MRNFSKLASQWIHSHREEMVSDIRSFCRIRSVSRADLAESGAPFGRECRAMLDFALAHARGMGLRTEEHEGYCGSAILGDGENAIGILTHIDIVPEGEGWIAPPFEPMREGDFLFGRGVSDNKCAAVMGLYLMRMFRELNYPLRHGIRTIMGCAEETGMEDLAYYAKRYPLPRVSLIPDALFPTNYAQKGALNGSMRIALGEQIQEFSGGEVCNMVPPRARAVLSGIPAARLSLGPAFEISEENGHTQIACQGVAAHAARPESGVSAIHLLAKALRESGLLSGQSLAAMRATEEITSDYSGENMDIAMEDPDTGKTTMVVGVARTESGRLTLSLDCRLSVASDLPKTVESFERAAARLGFETFDLRAVPPVTMPKDDPRVRATQAAYRQITGDDAPPYATGGGTYARVFPNALTFGIHFPGEQPRPEGLPAAHGAAHAPNEFLHIPSFLKAMEIYALALQKLDDIV